MKRPKTRPLSGLIFCNRNLLQLLCLYLQWKINIERNVPSTDYRPTATSSRNLGIRKLQPLRPLPAALLFCFRPCQLSEQIISLLQYDFSRELLYAINKLQNGRILSVLWGIDS